MVLDVAQVIEDGGALRSELHSLFMERLPQRFTLVYFLLHSQLRASASFQTAPIMDHQRAKVNNNYCFQMRAALKTASGNTSPVLAK